MPHFFADSAGDDGPMPDPTIHVPPELLLGVGALLVLALIWLLTTYVFKFAVVTRLAIITALLFSLGVGSYSVAPITATTALGLGMALALGSTLLHLSAANLPAKNHKQ